MLFSNEKFNYWNDSSIVKELEGRSDFLSLEESLINTINYLDSRYSVILAYDYITNPKTNRDNDMLFKVRHGDKEIMWVYLLYSKRAKYISLEIDNDTVSGIKMSLSGFESIKERHYQNYPTLKLRFHNYAHIERSLKDICDCLDNPAQGGTSNANGINIPLTPKGIIHKSDGTIQCLCGRCGISFIKAERCPECGQLVLYNGDSNKTGDKRILHVGDDVSKMKIYEIINKYFGENYNAWMKASYIINDNYRAWFPTITKTSTRPNGKFGGTEMWSNVLSPDRKTIITINHDEPNRKSEENTPRKRILVFARIDGSFSFLGVFSDRLVPEAELLTFQRERIAQGIDLDTFQLIDED